MSWLRALALALFLPLAPAVAAAELVMVEQVGCAWCARWHRDIGPIYDRTPEGAFAPVRFIDLRAEPPADLAFSGPLRITPTFVLIVDGTERARFEGYPGEDFFWSLLGKMLRDHANYTGGT